MSQSVELIIGQGKDKIILHSKMANRHGLIAGATGTGKTISLKVLAEQFSEQGIPVFLADVKGDLASLAEKGVENPKLLERINNLGLSPFEFKDYPVRLWDVFGELGHPLRTTVSEMGPLLLTRILELNDTQAGVLNIVFRVADEQGLLLIDLKDLRAMIQHVGDHADEYTTQYGNVSKTSIGAIQRSLLTLEDQGGNNFFAEPAFEILDLMKVDSYGRGTINVLASEKLMMSPTLYSTFLLWLLSELFEELPEVGDIDKPKLVFFFDEAHLLFSDAPKALLDKIELVVRLIRSKGVGVYFVTQNPIDIPDKVLGQLGNRIQHAIRAFTPKEQKAITAMAETFRQNPEIDIPTVITELKTGEALVSMLDLEGRPEIVQRAMIYPPHSLIGTLTPLRRTDLIENSPFHYKYHQIIDKESAFEMLKNKIETQTIAHQTNIESKQLEKERRQAEIDELKLQRERAKTEREIAKAKEKSANQVQRMAKSFLGTMSSSIGREIARGVFGSLLKR
ncbi:MAG TPA: helicase HerA-like domain-containing protein [Erysipelotrichaceae bacterium]|nr:helicase HerA-like domain-containing protein [Erysipelotrichaceae bacterium]